MANPERTKNTDVCDEIEDSFSVCPVSITKRPSATTTTRVRKNVAKFELISDTPTFASIAVKDAKIAARNAQKSQDWRIDCMEASFRNAGEMAVDAGTWIHPFEGTW